MLAIFSHSDIVNKLPYWFYTIHAPADLLAEIIDKQPGVFKYDGFLYYRLKKFHGPIINITKRMLDGVERYVPTRVVEMPFTSTYLDKIVSLHASIWFDEFEGHLFPHYLSKKLVSTDYEDPRKGWKPGFGDRNAWMIRFKSFKFTDWDQFQVLSNGFVNYRIEAACVTINIQWGSKEFVVTVAQLVSWLLQEKAEPISTDAAEFFNYLAKRYEIFHWDKIEIVRGAESEEYPYTLYPYNEIEINSFGLSGSPAYDSEFEEKYADLGKDWSISAVKFPYMLMKYIKEEIFIMTLSHIRDWDNWAEFREDERR